MGDNDSGVRAAEDTAAAPLPSARASVRGPSTAEGEGEPRLRGPRSKRSGVGGSRAERGPHGASSSTRPTPARVLESAGGSSEGPAPKVEKVDFECDGEEWVATLVGRSGGGRGSVPLAWLRFDPVPTGESAPAREVMIVGRSVTELSESELIAALRRSDAVEVAEPNIPDP
jgi:hypothetical protein